MIKNRLVLIDAFALIHRAFHALPSLSSKDGQQVNAVYGFTSALLSAIKELEPEYLAVGFDLPGLTKRHKEFKDYKAHRPATPDELKSQIPYIKEILQAMNIPIVAAEGYEGEDVIATIIASCKQQTADSLKFKKPLAVSREPLAILESIIVTGDMDALQLVDENTKVYSISRGINQAEMYDEKKVRERYGLEPKQLIDYKALRGDPSDNIPGVKGIGEKTAAHLVREYGTLEKLYRKMQNANLKSQSDNEKFKIKSQKTRISEKLQKILLENKERAFLSQKLAKIATNVPLGFDLESARLHDFDQAKIIGLFEKFGFKSLISRLPKADSSQNQPTLL